MTVSGRKFVILVGDGMGDFPLDELNGRTPLEVARTPNIDRLCSIGKLGLVKTVPEGMDPGSDVANMSLLGYDPKKYHTGRGPLEAASMGIKLEPGDVAFRCNLVTVGNVDGSKVMIDYSGGHISTEEARQIIEDLQPALEGLPLKLNPGISYRHLLIWENGIADLKTTPPHDIIGQRVDEYERVYFEVPVLREFRARAEEILRNHPINRQRLSEGKNPVTTVWPWGQGHAPAMKPLKDICGLSGIMISAVDLLKGIGVYAGFKVPHIPGATGYLDTNYEGKVEAAIDGLSQHDIAYVHIEAPDEASHEGSIEKKIEAIESFDEYVVGPVVERLVQFEKVDLLIVTDHLTPVKLRTHVSDPVPFLLIRDLPHSLDDLRLGSGKVFCEKTASKGTLNFPAGVELFGYFTGCLNR